MSFGAALAGFANGFVSGASTMSGVRLRAQQANLIGEKVKEEENARGAREEIKAEAKRLRGVAPTASSTQAIQLNAPAASTQAIAVPAAPAVAIPVAEQSTPLTRLDPEYDPSNLPRYAEGGLVTREELPPIEPQQAVPVAAVPVAPAAPAQAAPAVAIPVTPQGNAPPAAPPGNYNDPEMQEKVPDPVQGGLEYMREAFGLQQQAAPAAPQQAIPGAAPAAPAPADPQLMQRATAMIRGEGAATNEEVRAAAQRVDPEGTMPLAKRNAALLEAATGIYYARGMIKEGNEASASLLQNFRRNMQMYGGMAVAAAESGNMEQAAKLLTRAYDYVPDGNTMEAKGTGAGLSVTTLGPDGKPKGPPMVLADANAVRNAVGYATDMDNWAKHLLTERKVNGELELGQGRLAEMERHNKASEGLQGAALADSRAARGRAQRQEGEADAAFQAVRMAEVEARRAEAALNKLGEDATPEQRQAAEQRLEAARTRAEDLEARLPARAASALSTIEARDSAASDRRAALDFRLEESRLRRAAAAETDPLKRKKLEAEIEALQARARGTGRAAAGAAGVVPKTMADLASIDEAIAGADPGRLNPAQVGEARELAQTLAGLNSGMSAMDYANVGMRIRQGDFQFTRTAEGEPAVRVGTRVVKAPPSMLGAFTAYRDQAKPVERTGPGIGETVDRVGRSIGGALTGTVRDMTEQGSDRPNRGSLRVSGEGGMAAAADRVSKMLQGQNPTDSQLQLMIDREAARFRVSPSELRKALNR